MEWLFDPRFTEIGIEGVCLTTRARIESHLTKEKQRHTLPEFQGTDTTREHSLGKLNSNRTEEYSTMWTSDEHGAGLTTNQGWCRYARHARRVDL